ncbi:hypothetical protein ES705_29658 [subsurface metagenome]
MSVGDWEFKLLSDWSECTTWYLNTDEYISSPSCLLLPRPLDNNDFNLAVYNGSYHDLPEGRFDFWFRTFAIPTYSQVALFLGVTDLGARSIDSELIGNPGDWQRFRVTWWYAYDYQNVASTRVKIEQYVADEWVQLSETDYPALPGTDCRVAIGCRKYTGRADALIDDCNIYKGTE